MKRIILLPLIVGALSFPSAVFGLGIRLTDQDADATARGEAFVATADNPSAIYYNPAGITQLQGFNVQTGAYAITLKTKYTSSTGLSVGTLDGVHIVPQTYYAYSFKEVPISIGLGIYSPYGLSLEYPDNVGFRQAALEGGVTYICVNPVIAWKINDQLSVAAGITLNYADATLRRGILPVPGNDFKFEGHGFDTGFNFGILWKPATEHAFGLNYHSTTDIGLDGHSTASVPFAGVYSVEGAATHLKFPQYITAGYSYRPTPEWNFEFDVDWADWHQLKTVVLRQERSGSIALPFNWESSFMYRLGATRYLQDGYQVSAGYIYSQCSVPKSSFNPVVPDSDRHVVSAGFGRKVGKYSWELAYQFAYGPPTTIANGTPADGTYRFLSHAVTVSFGYHF